MAVLEYTIAEINDMLASTRTLKEEIGNLDELLTTDKDNLVDAANELFISADEGKVDIVAALVGKGIDVTTRNSFDELAASITALPTPWIANESNIVPTGTYANSTYYNTSFGVKVGYSSNGDIMVCMKSGTTSSYENLVFSIASAPSGVTITTSSSTSWGTSVAAGQLYVCIISGVKSKCEMAIDMSSYNGSYDYTACAITLTEVAE